MSFNKNKLSTNELESILWYTQDGYQILNMKKSQLTKDDKEEINNYLPYLEEL